VGNRLTEARPSGNTLYTYNSADELTQMGSTAYGYDQNGNRTSAGSKTYAYDLANRLVSLTDGSITSYSYDGDGNRVATNAGSQTTTYVWDSNHSLAQLAIERDGGGGVLRRYVQGLRRISMSAGGSNHYFHYDSLGSVSNLTSSTGGGEWTYAYEPFGPIRTQTQDDPLAPQSPMRFAGELADSTDLYYLRARQYEPLVGRFLQPDPARASHATPYLSVYAYVANRPTIMVDPSGMSFSAVNSAPQRALLAASPPPPCLFQSAPECWNTSQWWQEPTALLLTYGTKAMIAWAVGREVRAIDVRPPFISGKKLVPRFRLRVAGAGGAVAQIGIDYLDGQQLTTTARFGRAGLAAASAVISAQVGVTVGGVCTAIVGAPSGGAGEFICIGAGVGSAWGVSRITNPAASRLSKLFGWGPL
jgi:RHS repeat-associated protein